MGVFLNTNYRVWADNSAQVGWPRPTTAQPLWAYQRIAKGCAEFRQAGFSGILLPPFTQGAAGQWSGGYDKFDDYSIDGTAFGSSEMLRQCIAVIHAHEMQAYGDLVVHQYGGGTAAGDYTYRGSLAPGRFPKHAACFVGAPPRVAADPVPDSNGNFAFGDMASYVNSTPAGYMRDGAIAAAQWLTQTTGVDGWRVDDVKGTNAGFVYDLLQSPAIRNLWAFGEYFDGSNSALGGWVNYWMKRRAAVLDFGFKFNVGNVCNNNSRVWMGQLSAIGYCAVDAAMAVTFIESADTDSSPGEQVVWNKILGYAIMLTFPGYPSVYWRDWSTDAGCYGLKDQINNLVWIHENLAQGDFVVRLDTDPQVFVHERTGFGSAPGCVCFFNNDQWNSYTRTVQTNLGANQRVHEYTGNGEYNDRWTDAQGRLTATVPPNNNGMSYLVFAKPISPPAFGWQPLQTTQHFFGARDLAPPSNCPPLTNSAMQVCRVWAAQGTLLSVTLTPDRAGWGNSVEVPFWVSDATGELHRIGYDDQGHASQGFTVRTRATGWHTVTVSPTGMPTGGSAFSMKLDYIGGTP